MKNQWNIGKYLEYQLKREKKKSMKYSKIAIDVYIFPNFILKSTYIGFMDDISWYFKP